MASSKIKYAKLRLFKPSPSAGGEKQLDPQQENGKCPKSPPRKSVEQMEQEIINFSVENIDNNVATGEPIIKRTRLDSLESADKPILKLPKLPKKPPEEGLISKFFKPPEDDFEDTKKVTVPKIRNKAQKNPKPRKPRAPRKPKDQSDIRKVFEKYKNNDEDQLLQNLMLEHSVADRLDPEQLQIALAMSRSLVDQGGSQSVEPQSSVEDAQVSCSMSSTSSEERRIQGIRATLEQYGFKCKSSYNDYDLNVIFGSKTAKPKNARKVRHKRPTMLKRRDRGELEGFMTAQIERLLKEELYCPLADCSGANFEMRTYGSNVFWMSQNEEESEKILSDYYVEGLMEPSSVKAGYLLKDWKMIPGRDTTPEREIIPFVMEEEREEKVRECEGYELGENDPDLLADMDTVPEEYRQKYNNEAPVYTRFRKNLVVPSTPKRSVSPELFASDSGDEERIVDERTGEQELSKNHDHDEGHDGNISASPLCRSSENIFDDSDPIIDYELYSSEEVKISTTGQEKNNAGTLSSLCRPSTQCQALMDKTFVIALSSEEDSNHSTGYQRIQNATKRASTSEVDCETKEKEQRLQGDPFTLPKKNLSFHALALQYKMSHISLANVETINLEADDAEVERGVGHEAISVEESFEYGSQPAEEPTQDRSTDHSKLSSQSNPADEHSDEDVMVISDDEVNYSVQQEYSLQYNIPPTEPDDSADQTQNNDSEENIHQEANDKPEEDLDCTKEYFNVEEFKKLQSRASTSQIRTNDIHTISSDEDDATERVLASPAKANNTMAFLDGLISKFNLPSAANQSTKRDNPRHSTLDEYLDNYEIPDFTTEIREEFDTEVSDNAPTAKPVPSEQLDQEIEQILSKAQQACSQFESTQSRPVKRIASDSALLVSKSQISPIKSPRKPKQSVKDKFKALTEEIEPAQCEYEIRLENVSPRPEYDGMSSPQLQRELYKYGLKQLRRPKAVKILNHIYDRTHPMVEVVEVEVEDAEKGANLDAMTEREEQTDCPVKTMEGLKLLEKDAFVPEMGDEEYILPSKPRKKVTC